MVLVIFNVVGEVGAVYNFGVIDALFLESELVYNLKIQKTPCIT